MVGDNPLAGADVPPGVAVAQQRLHSVHAPEKKGQGHKKGEVRQGREQSDCELGSGGLHGIYAIQEFATGCIAS